MTLPRARNRDPLTVEILRWIRSVPRGRVSTYGAIAALAGNPGAARQVVRILHACSDRERLPWHRIINSRGGISLRPGAGAESQRRRLENEGVRFDAKGRVDLDVYLWAPAPKPKSVPAFPGLDIEDLRRFARRRRASRSVR